MGMITRVGVQTHQRPSNYDLYALQLRRTMALLRELWQYLPNSYGILVFLLESQPKRRLRREARKRVGKGHNMTQFRADVRRSMCVKYDLGQVHPFPSVP